MARWIAMGLTVLFLANGLFMMAAPNPWYLAVPGVIQTGPFNDHFVRDIGAAYLASGVGAGLSALNPRRYAGAMAVAATFQGLHAGIHLVTPLCGEGPPWPLWARDFPGVFLPALLAIGLTVLAFRRAQEA